jgi:hypothetical protein
MGCDEQRQSLSLSRQGRLCVVAVLRWHRVLALLPVVATQEDCLDPRPSTR